MKYAWLVVVTISARYLVVALGFPPGDGDLAWQGWLGRTILATHHIPRALGAEALSAAGAPWTPQEWLFSIGLASLPWNVFAFAVALCPATALIVTAYRGVRRGADPFCVTLATAAAGTALFDSFGVRAQVVAWPLLALFTAILDNEGPWVWAAVPAAAAWSNFHASAMLAPLLAGAAFAGRFSEDRAWTPRVRRIACVAVACGLAICCNPFGIGLPLYALSLFGSPIKIYISEWKATDLGEFSFSFGALPLFLAVVVLGIAMRSRRMMRAEDMVIFAASAFLLFFAGRNVPIFALLVAPLCAHLLTVVREASPHVAPSKPPGRLADIALITITSLLTIFVGYELLHNPARKEITMPLKEVEALAGMPGEHRVMCADFAWCSYFLGKPDQSVFLDGRADPYPPKVWTEFGLIAYLRPGWSEVLDRYAIDAVIVKRNAATDQALALTHQWRDAAHDVKFRLWMRKAIRPEPRPL